MKERTEMNEENERTYLAIDLKSFYASVECMERGLDPMTTHLVVADAERTEKTICLAVSPSLRACGVSGRARLFQVVQKVQEINALRRQAAPGHKLTGSSWNAEQLSKDPSLALEYVVALPRMALYMERSRQIYQVYLKHIAPEDMHVYSIDEVFMDVTGYLAAYRLSAEELARRIILDVLETTGITATAGIGPNLYLAKTAMDIGAKHIQADENGVRIARLDEMSYRRMLWDHRPLTDFWRVGRGYAAKLEEQGIFTMGDIALCSVGKKKDYYNEDLLYRLFGINAELLIDHAWGWEPCTIQDIRNYKPESSSIGSGQILPCPYTLSQARLVVREMADQLALSLVDQRLAADQLVLTAGYDIENLQDGERRSRYTGEITKDRYGRSVPKHAHGTINLEMPTSSARAITQAALELFDRILNPELLVRRLYLTANHTVPEASVQEKDTYEQLELFTDYEALEKQRQAGKAQREKERKLQEAMLSIKKKYGKNAILKGTSLEEGATARERNRQIGGHKA